MSIKLYFKDVFGNLFSSGFNYKYFLGFFITVIRLMWSFKDFVIDIDKHLEDLFTATTTRS